MRSVRPFTFPSCQIQQKTRCDPINTQQHNNTSLLHKPKNKLNAKMQTNPVPRDWLQHWCACHHHFALAQVWESVFDCINHSLCKVHARASTENAARQSKQRNETLLSILLLSNTPMLKVMSPSGQQQHRKHGRHICENELGADGCAPSHPQHTSAKQSSNQTLYHPDGEKILALYRRSAEAQSC